jgi:hypothetical protein
VIGIILSCFFKWFLHDGTTIPCISNYLSNIRFLYRSNNIFATF